MPFGLGIVPVHATIEHDSHKLVNVIIISKNVPQHGVDYLKAARIEKRWETATLSVFWTLVTHSLTNELTFPDPQYKNDPKS